MLASARKVLGDTLGRYQLLVQIGQGGMAEVFLGRLRGAAGFAKLVVLKRMHTHLSHDKRFIELFINEGRMVAQLSHPNICQVHELGEEEGSLFLVMEYLNGVPWEALARELPRGSPQELPLIAGVLGQACDGLHYAHQLRDHAGNPTPVVHRDVSPQNLFVTTDGMCKVLDFGVAKMQTSERYSHTGVVLGKLPYMAPEQICGQPVDPRTDVFAMGAVLWEVLTGERLFLRKSDYLIWKAINEDPIPSVLERRPELPAAVDAVVQKALQRDPADRFSTIQAFAQELRAAAAPAAFATHAIADALRQLCGAQLAESSVLVGTALYDIDRPHGDRSPTVEEAAGDTIQSPPVISVMLRDESFARIAAPRRWRWRWRWHYAVIPAAMAAAVIAAVVTYEEQPQGEQVSAAMPSATKAVEASSATATDAIKAAAPTITAKATDSESVAKATAPTITAKATDSESVARAVPDEKSPRGQLSADASSKPDGPDEPRRKRSTNRPARPPPVRPPAAEAEPATTRGEQVTPRIGHYSVDSRPYATITIDGVAHGETPLYRIPLDAGAHQVRAVRQDGATKTFSITISAGKEVSSGRLKW